MLFIVVIVLCIQPRIWSACFLNTRVKRLCHGHLSWRKPSLLKDCMISSDPDSGVFAWPWVCVCVPSTYTRSMSQNQPLTRPATYRGLRHKWMLSLQFAVCVPGKTSSQSVTLSDSVPSFLMLSFRFGTNSSGQQEYGFNQQGKSSSRLCRK